MTPSFHFDCHFESQVQWGQKPAGARQLLWFIGANSQFVIEGPYVQAEGLLTEHPSCDISCNAFM